ncbi:MAG TPA: GNAT family N-acetyltransferase [Nitrospiraceae bacterium]|nr:GNAT family N-acetyltransferase [Nitrospiraceae bacterium]
MSDLNASKHPSESDCNAIAALMPDNPFLTFAYCEARRRLGDVPWSFTLRRHGEVTDACLGFMRQGALNKSLEVASLPPLHHADAFWSGLLNYCDTYAVSSLHIQNFGSADVRLPVLRSASTRKARSEYVLRLTDRDVIKAMRPSHRQRANRAAKAGLKIVQTSDVSRCAEHLRMMAASCRRRTERGEAVSIHETASISYEAQVMEAYLTSGAGVLFQALRGDHVLSSALVLLAERGAYYQTSGTSSEGMSCGASHFLVSGIAQHLQADGKEVLNLGGVDETGSGLEEFKLGFGTERRDMEAAEFFVGHPLRRHMTVVLSKVRRVLLSMSAKHARHDSESSEVGA